MNASFLDDAEEILSRLRVVANLLEVHAPGHEAVHDACRQLALALSARHAATGSAVTLHTDGDGFFLDGYRLGFDVFGHQRAQRAFSWFSGLGANELRAHPPIEAASVEAFLDEVREALQDGALRPTLADTRPGRISLRQRAHLLVRHDQERDPLEALAADLETAAAWVQDALPAADSGWPPTLGIRRALWRVAERAASTPAQIYAIALRPDPEDGLHRHLARSALLSVGFAMGLGLRPARAVEGVLRCLEASLGLGSLGSVWWKEDGAAHARALRERAPRSGELDGLATQRSVRVEEIAALTEALPGPVDIPYTLEASVFAAACWFDRVRQGLQTEIPRCTPLQARAALEPWARRRSGLPVGLAFALGALLGPVPPGSVVRCEGMPGVLRGADEVACVDAEGRLVIRREVAGVSAACSEPDGVPAAFFAARE